MKKAAIFVLVCFFSLSARAEEDVKFYENVLISNDVKLEEKSVNAKDKASSLLDKKPTVIKIEGAPLSFRSQQAAQIALEDTTTKYGEAPFGLSWGATYNQTKALGVRIERVEIKDYTNTFKVERLPKQINDFREIVVSFGEENSLWRILAYGRMFDDDNNVSKGLRLYRQYYKLLSQKYGNAKEFYTPKVSKVETLSKDGYGRDKIDISTKEEPVGGDNFLQELQSGEASLYATFEDSSVGAALALSVDTQGRSYIIIDYTNLEIFRERENKTLNAL